MQVAEQSSEPKRVAAPIIDNGIAAAPGGASMRRFHFNRTEDASGISGLGRVAEGVLFDNGLIALSWISLHKCVNIYASYAEMMAVHGHDGDTELIWEDSDPKAAPEPEPEEAEAEAKPKPKGNGKKKTSTKKN
jgi:hypothetical protein